MNALDAVIKQQYKTFERLGVLPISALEEAVDSADLGNLILKIKLNGRYSEDLEIVRSLEDKNSEHSYVIISEPFYLRIRRAKDLTAQKQAANTLLAHCQYVIRNTLIWKNQETSHYRKIQRQLKKASQGSTPLTVEELPEFISEMLCINVDILEKIEQKSNGSEVHFIRRSGHGKERRTTAHINDTNLTNLLVNDALGQAKTVDVSTYFSKNSQNSYMQYGPTIVVPLCRASARSSSRNQLLLLYSSDVGRPLKSDDVDISERLVSYLLEDILYARQREYISHMLESIAQLASNTSDIPEDDHFEHVLQVAVNRIVTDSSAYRCSIWKVNERFGILEPHEMASYESGELSDSYSVRRAKIPIKNKTSSTIAYALAGALGKGHILINNCSNPTKDLKGEEIDDIIQPSGETQSELAIQIRETGVPYGVLLAESRLGHGFDSDLWLIKAVTTLLSEYRRTMLQKLDSQYVVERLSIFDTSHDLDMFLDMQLKEHPEIARRFREYLLPKDDIDDHKGRIESFTLSEITNVFEQEYRVLFMEDTINRIFSRFYLSDVPPLASSIGFKSAISYILKNLISNAVRYDVQSNTTIGARLENEVFPWAGINEQVIDSKAKMLHIDCVISPSLPQNIINSVGRMSVKTRTRGQRHGLYLVGLIVRQCGGSFLVGPTPKGDRTRLTIRIPVTLA